MNQRNVDVVVERAEFAVASHIVVVAIEVADACVVAITFAFGVAFGVAFAASDAGFVVEHSFDLIVCIAVVDAHAAVVVAAVVFVAAILEEIEVGPERFVESSIAKNLYSNSVEHAEHMVAVVDTAAVFAADIVFVALVEVVQPTFAVVLSVAVGPTEPAVVVNYAAELVEQSIVIAAVE